MKKIEDRYFQFLSDQVLNEDYYNLLEQLYKIPVYTFIPNDDNREFDGKKLREIFCEHERGHKALPLCLDDPCTMLEMIIGLAYRMEDELAIGPYDMKMPECFWTIIENLELGHLDDRDYHVSANDIINDRISALLSRRYASNGRGGLFPLKNPSCDQRKVEIWYQMSEWLLENFEF